MTDTYMKPGNVDFVAEVLERAEAYLYWHTLLRSLNAKCATTDGPIEKEGAICEP